MKKNNSNQPALNTQLKDSIYPKWENRENLLLIQRKPLFNQKLKTVGYEIGGSQSQTKQKKLSSSMPIVYALSDLGADRILHGHPAWIDLSNDLSQSDVVLPLAPEKIIIKLNEKTNLEKVSKKALQEVHKKGYQIALDYSLLKQEASLVDFTNIVLVDADRLEAADFIKALEMPLKSSVQKVATQVNSEGLYTSCKEAGFEYFQGNFFIKPPLIKTKTIPKNRQAILQLLRELHQSEPNIDQIISLVEQDPVFSYRILKILQSPMYGTSQEIQSIGHAVVMLGLANLRNVVVSVALSNVRNQAEELIMVGLTRGRMCQTLGRDFQIGDPNVHFTVGLLSIIDTILGIPKSQLFEQISLTEELKQALLSRSGPYGQILNWVESYERGEWNNIREKSPEILTFLSDAWLDAVTWSGNAYSLFQ